MFSNPQYGRYLWGTGEGIKMTRAPMECQSPFWDEAKGQSRNAHAWLDKCAITVPSGGVPWTETFVTLSAEHKCNFCHTNISVMSVDAYEVSSQTRNPKALPVMHIYKKENWSQFNFCHYPFPTPDTLILQIMKVNNVNSFIPRVNYDHVHISKSYNSIRTAGDQKIKATTFPTALQT